MIISIFLVKNQNIQNWNRFGFGSFLASTSKSVVAGYSLHSEELLIKNDNKSNLKYQNTMIYEWVNESNHIRKLIFFGYSKNIMKKQLILLSIIHVRL